MYIGSNLGGAGAGGGAGGAGAGAGAAGAAGAGAAGAGAAGAELMYKNRKIFDEDSLLELPSRSQSERNVVDAIVAAKWNKQLKVKPRSSEQQSTQVHAQHENSILKTISVGGGVPSNFS
jgi:hypothetical protein